jgi:hypothetical protein
MFKPGMTLGERCRRTFEIMFGPMIDEPMDYSTCYGCGNRTRTLNGRCDLCGDAKEPADAKG